MCINSSFIPQAFFCNRRFYSEYFGFRISFFFLSLFVFFWYVNKIFAFFFTMKFRVWKFEGDPPNLLFFKSTQSWKLNDIFHWCEITNINLDPLFFILHAWKNLTAFSVFKGLRNIGRLTLNFQTLNYNICQYIIPIVQSHHYRTWFNRGDFVCSRLEIRDTFVFL